MGVSVQDMIARLRYNNSLQHKKRLFKKDKSYHRLKGEFQEKAEKDKIQLKTATPEQLAAIRKKILLEKKAEKVMQWVIVLIFAPLITFGVYVYYNALNPPPAVNIENKIALQEAKKERQEQYTYFITTGDDWLAEYNWYNAIFEYKKALEIFPRNFDANYRLALAYTYNCQDSKERCQEAEQLIFELLKAYPDNPDLYLLRASYLYNLGDSAKAMLDYEKVDLLLEKNGLPQN